MSSLARLPRAWRGLVLVFLLLPACHVSVPEFTTDPSPDALDFPAGLAVDPGGRLLYVSNGNADLRYGGGTVMAFDLERFECALDAFNGLPPAPGCSVFPSATDILVERDGTNFPIKGCVADPVDPQIVDCVERPFALQNSTVRVGNFAGTIRLRRTGGPGSTTRTLYLVVRGDPSVTFIDLDTQKLAAAPDSGGHIDSPGFFDCFDDDASLLARSEYDRATNTTRVPPRCDKSHLIQTYKCDGDFGCLENADDGNNNDIPSEPFNLLLEEGTKKSGAPYAQLLIGHLAPGNVTLVDLLGAPETPGVPRVVDVSPPFFAADQGGRRGVFGLARRDDPVSPLYYLTSNLSPAISTFSLEDQGETTTVVPGVVFSIAGPFSSGVDGREILFDQAGQRAFLSQNAPPSLAVLDTRRGEPQGRGLPANKIVDTVPICQAASHMALRQSFEAGPAGADATRRSRLYLACFISNQVMVVDPDRPGVDETILVGRGPTELAFNFSGEETAPADRLPAPRRRRAYVTLYGESTIGVIDLEPGSPTENRLVARIGLPVPANKQ